MCVIKFYKKRKQKNKNQNKINSTLILKLFNKLPFNLAEKFAFADTMYLTRRQKKFLIKYSIWRTWLSECFNRSLGKYSNFCLFISKAVSNKR